MTRQILDIGSNANDGTGDTLRAAMQKVNENFAELYGVSIDNSIEISGNNITATRSNDNINLIPAGTGVVTMNSITIDDNINITDNIIKTTKSNASLKFIVSGTGSLRIDSLSFKDNTIFTSESNADLELSANGTGTVSLNSLNFPTTDGSVDQVLKTDGSGNLGWATVTAGTFTYIVNADGTASITGSSIADIDTFNATTYRSAKYSVSMYDSTNNRSGIRDFFVTHDGSTAYIGVAGITSTGANMATFSADISGGNVRIRAVLASGDGTVFKFSKVLFLA
jgi:hypothetical protein